jgi:hypothetical protein
MEFLKIILNEKVLNSSMYFMDAMKVETLLIF